jgi:hypothetical protein
MQMGTDSNTRTGRALSPKMFSCEEWGAAPVDLSALTYGKAEGIVLHHTATENREPTGDLETEKRHAFRLAREIQHGHMAFRHWPDSGQHFTVSAGGLMLEGRHGSVTAARGGLVIHGTHAKNAYANAHYYGVECEGNFMKQAPNPKEWEAIIDLCAWLCVAGKIDATKIYPHCQFRPTQCPGMMLRQRIPYLRQCVRRRKLELFGQMAAK